MDIRTTLKISLYNEGYNEAEAEHILSTYEKENAQELAAMPFIWNRTKIHERHYNDVVLLAFRVAKTAYKIDSAKKH